MMLAGERAGPLRIRISGIRSSSKLVDAAAQGLQFDVDFTPKPLRFLSALTADIVALGGVTGYGATVHVRMTNPLPQLVRVREVDVQAHYVDIDGPVIYNYKRHVAPPQMNPDHYTLQAEQNLTLSFELSPLREVTWNVVHQAFGLLDHVKHRVVTAGVDMMLVVEIGGPDGFVQSIRYRNRKLTGDLCFSLLPPRTPCGDLPRNGNRTDAWEPGADAEDAFYWDQ